MSSGTRLAILSVSVEQTLKREISSN